MSSISEMPTELLITILACVDPSMRPTLSFVCKKWAELFFEGVLSPETSLDSSYTVIKKLPRSISSFKSVKSFNLHGCRFLSSIPETIGELVSLEILDLGWCTRITELPGSIGKLKKLRVLVLDYTSLTRLPKEVGELVSLERLYLKDCTKLKSLRRSLGSLEKLELIRIEGCYMLKKIPRRILNNEKIAFYESYSDIEDDDSD